MRTRLIRISTAIILTLGVIVVGAKAGGTFDLVDVAQKVLDRHNRLQRLFVDLYMTTNERGESQTDRCALAFAPELGYLDFMHSTGAGTAPWRDNARFQVWMRGDSVATFNTFNRLSWPDADPRFREYWKSPYCQALGWHPQTKFLHEDKLSPFHLDEIFAHGRLDALQIANDTEQIDSHKCLLVQSRDQHDRLWLAPKLGFALVKRVLISRDHNQSQRTWYCSDFAEDAPGLWLPRKVDCQFCKSTDVSAKPFRSFRLEITKLYVNDNVPDDLFTFVPPPGTLTMQGAQPVAFQAGGKDLLDFWCAVCLDAFPPKPTQARGALWVSVPLAVAFSGLGLGCVLLINRRRPRASP